MSRHSREQRRKRRRRCQSLLLMTSAITASSYSFLANIIMNSTNRLPYHTSALKGAQWVRELLLGNPQRIKDNLGLHKQCFRRLVTALEIKSGLRLSKHGVTTYEQVAIFLYVVTTGLTMQRVAERFQRSMSTINRRVTPFIDPISIVYVRGIN